MVATVHFAVAALVASVGMADPKLVTLFHLKARRSG